MDLHGLDPEVARDVDLQLLTAAVGRLPLDQRAVLLLRELDVHTREEVAAIAGCPADKADALLTAAYTALADPPPLGGLGLRARPPLLAASGGAPPTREALRRHVTTCESCTEFRLSITRRAPLAVDGPAGHAERGPHAAGPPAPRAAPRRRRRTRRRARAACRGCCGGARGGAESARLHRLDGFDVVTTFRFESIERLGVATTPTSAIDHARGGSTAAREVGRLPARRRERLEHRRGVGEGHAGEVLVARLEVVDDRLSAAPR